MVYITGDIHGSLEPIYELYDKYKPEDNDIIVILGDVGINYTGTLNDIRTKRAMNRLGATFFCIHGNHENRPQNIGTYEEKEWLGGRVLCEPDYPNILFPIDGDIFELEGKKCIVIGGAYSVDKFYRLRNGYKWWPDEQPSPTIKEYVEKQISEHDIDVVFSHTCPYKYIPTECFMSGIDQSRVDNSTEQWLDKLNQDDANDRRMDIFMCNARTVESDSGIYMDENIIVELKAPHVSLSNTVYRQIEDYMLYIKKQPSFNSIRRRWKFIAVCCVVDDDVKSRYKRFLYIDSFAVTLEYNTFIWKKLNSKATPFWLCIEKRFEDEKWRQDEQCKKAMLKIPYELKDERYIALTPKCYVALSEVAEDMKKQVFKYIQIFKET